jgi:hypothetical protein
LNKPDRHFRVTELLFIDSGGYELSPDYDSTEPKQGVRECKPFRIEEYSKILGKLPQSLPIVATSWDAPGKSVDEQIADAQRFFNSFPHLTRNFLIKPTGTETRKQKKKKSAGTSGQKQTKHIAKKYIDVAKDVVPHIAKLRAFDILGVTEKELGKDLLHRLQSLARLRAAMDREDLTIPIHVWGGLDPVITPLYFFAGAEIFDGVSWLRYAYHNGIAVYRDCCGILDGGIEPMDHVRAKALFGNLSCLRRITNSLRLFVDKGGDDFNVFEWNADAYRRAYNVLGTEVPELRGGA